MSNQDPNQLRIQTPCPKAWEELVGDKKKRYCSSCSLHVHNAEALTRKEAETVLQEGQGRVCMRIVLDENGQAKFRPEDKPAPSKLKAAGLALAASGILAACQPTQTEPVPSQPVTTTSTTTDSTPPANPSGTPTNQPADKPADKPAGTPILEPLEILGEVDLMGIVYTPPAVIPQPDTKKLDPNPHSVLNGDVPDEPESGTDQPQEPVRLMGRVHVPLPKVQPDKVQPDHRKMIGKVVQGPGKLAPKDLLKKPNNDH